MKFRTISKVADVVFIWINENNGKCYVSANANPLNKDNWIEQNKYKYEREMLTGDHRIPPEMVEDLANGDTFVSISFTFDEEQKGFDYANQLVQALKTLQDSAGENFTYCLNQKSSKIRDIKDSVYAFETINQLLQNLKFSNLDNRSTMAFLIEQELQNIISGEGINYNSRDRVNKLDNSYTRQIAIDQKKKEKAKPVICPKCHGVLPLSKKCASCDD